MKERERIEKTREVLVRLARGTNPLTGEAAGQESLLNDPCLIRSFYDAAEVLENVLKGVYSKKRQVPFAISPEQKGRISLPDRKMGVNEFSKCVNAVLDLNGKMLNGVELNRKLKLKGILGEGTNADGKTVTVINDDSHRYGFEMEHRSRNGMEYDMILLNNDGKKFLLDHLEELMNLEVPA